MKILHRYILATLLKNVALSLFAFTVLFLIVEFFDRIDNMMPAEAGIITMLSYFLWKLPIIISLMLPVAMLIGTLFTVGLLSKSSEITAMRASGLTVAWIARPIYLTALFASIISIPWNELFVPHALRRAKEIYNLDIQKKHLSGAYNQSDFWWRNGNYFFSADMFDSRSNTLLDLVRLELDSNFDVKKRLTASRAQYLSPVLGWSMTDVVEAELQGEQLKNVRRAFQMPMPVRERPKDFYDVKTEPQTMSFSQLRGFIQKQSLNGVSTRQYLVDLYEKLASPFLIFIVVPVVLPFALKPARSGSLAAGFVAALVIAFSYYAVHSLSLALGRAEILHPLMAAWMANLVLGSVGLVLSLGQEHP